MTRAACPGSAISANSASTPRETPPWSVPPSTPSPAPTAAYGSARTEAATRTASVEAASSWSASRMSADRSAPTASVRGSAAVSRDHRRSGIEASAAGVVAADEWERLDHPGDEVAAGGDHRRRVEGEAERVGRREGDRDHLEVFERRGTGGQAGLRGAGDGDRLRVRPPHRALPGSGGLAGPQPVRDVLEGVRPGQAERVAPAVVGPVVAQHGDLGLDEQLVPAGRAPWPAAPGELLDLGRVEQAPPAAGRVTPPQHPAAHVGVQRRRLDPEPLRRARRVDPLIGRSRHRSPPH